MNQVIQIEWAAANIEEAREVCKKLVEQKLVACAQIIPNMESIYFWKGNVESASEVKVYLKTLDSRFSRVQDYILQNCSYELPEIIKVGVKGFDLYLNWIVELIK